MGRRYVQGLLGVVAALAVAAPEAGAVEVAIAPGTNAACSVFGASPTAQAGVGSVEGQGFLLCQQVSDLTPYSVTLTVCAQRAFFFRPTQILYHNVDACQTKTGVFSGGQTSRTDTVPCGDVPLYRTYTQAKILGWPTIEDYSDPRPSGCVL